MARKSTDVHTVPHGRGWINIVGGERTPVNHRTQAAAADVGRKIAVKMQSEHVIHGATGRIRDKDSYGNDPGKKRGSG